MAVLAPQAGPSHTMTQPNTAAGNTDVNPLLAMHLWHAHHGAGVCVEAICSSYSLKECQIRLRRAQCLSR